MINADSVTPVQVTVVVPVYNAEKYIRETLESIARQTFRNFEVIVVDDCSNDRSADIVGKFCALDQRFRYLRSPTNFGGPAGPRNLGIRASSSPWVAFCDADDVWVPHKLDVQMQVASQTGADVVSSEVRDFADGEPRPEFAQPEPPLPNHAIPHARLLLKNWIALSSVIVRRSALDAVGPFNEARAHIAVEDFDMWLRITAKGMTIRRVMAPLVHYRKLPTSISASKTMMVRKALNVIGEDYKRRGRAEMFTVIRPIHWLLYIGTSAWMRGVRRKL
jgi:teichuronic acid biosynthesis glycosyltransferase TuaG